MKNINLRIPEELLNEIDDFKDFYNSPQIYHATKKVNRIYLTEMSRNQILIMLLQNGLERLEQTFAEILAQYDAINEAEYPDGDPCPFDD